MTTKPMDGRKGPRDARQRAGDKAEQQMAFYLHREFATSSQVFVLNDLRIVDSERPEHDGRPGVCQIDHLIIHRWGAFIVESKSVTVEVSVRDSGSGDEWTRRFNGRDQGIASPIQQARLQGGFLREFLQSRRTSLLGRVAPGFRALARMLNDGSDQRGFRNMPIQIVVAVSDGGIIRRSDGWKEPVKPFQTFVCKADLVADRLREELDKHRASSSVLTAPKGEYGIWSMKAEELAQVASFLRTQHSPRSDSSGPQATLSARGPVPGRQPIDLAPDATHSIDSPDPSGASGMPVCETCGNRALAAKWGGSPKGYVWSCGNCGADTPMPTVCSSCGARGQRGQVVKIRKEGPNYF